MISVQIQDNFSLRTPTLPLEMFGLPILITLSGAGSITGLDSYVQSAQLQQHLLIVVIAQTYLPWLQLRHGIFDSGDADAVYRTSSGWRQLFRRMQEL